MMQHCPIFYIYPMFKHVSWTVISDKHCEQLKKYFRIYTIDELALPFIEMYSNPLLLLHPYFYPFQKWEDRLAMKFTHVRGVIGIDVADGDAISDYAVRLTNYALAMIVPSSFARDAYIRSGVKVPVHIVPHGVDSSWLSAPKTVPQTFEELAKLKERRKLKLILTYVMHSPYRKGLDILINYYRQLSNERNDVLLVLKTNLGVGYFYKWENYRGGNLEDYMDGVVAHGWLTEGQQMELFDLCDLYVLTSRGGGFEHPPLLALARGEVVLAARGGAWDDWMPDWGLVDSRKSDVVLAGNPIHTGRGVEMIVDKAVDKTLEIFDNWDDYKARVKEHVDTHVKNKLTWEIIGKQLAEIISSYV